MHFDVLGTREEEDFHLEVVAALGCLMDQA
jgi:hypothetical protein